MRGTSISSRSILPGFFLFLFCMLAPPYGSVYLERERTVMGESTLDVVRRYRQEGLDISADFHDAPDHITAELEFVHFLIFKALEAASDSTARARPLPRETQAFYAGTPRCMDIGFSTARRGESRNEFLQESDQGDESPHTRGLEEISVYNVSPCKRFLNH